MTTNNARPLDSLVIGDGPTIVLLHGFGMHPSTYARTARLLADRARVVIPPIFALPERWSFDHALDCLELTLDEFGADRVSLLGHSFGGGLELGLAERCPARIVECVFSDTLGVHRELSLALEAVHPIGILRMASVPAMRAFFGSFATHPVQLMTAGWWAFRTNRESAIEAIVSEGIPTHVLWAERDSILSRADGKDFADRLHATFTVVDPPPGYGPVDHDWMFDDPELFVQHLEELGLQALNPSAR
jgi:pimeloyl-ACP methyl ester carboxylesterase